MAKKRKLQHDASVPPHSSTKRQAMSFFDLPAEMRNAIYELLAATYMGESVLCWQQGLHVARPRLLPINRQFAEEAKGYIDDTRWKLTPIDLAKPSPLKSAQGNLSEFIQQQQHGLGASPGHFRPIRIPLAVPSGSIRLDTLTDLGKVLLLEFITRKAAREQLLEQGCSVSTGGQPDPSIAPDSNDSREASCYKIAEGGEIEFEMLDSEADDIYAGLAKLASWPSGIDPILLRVVPGSLNNVRSWSSIAQDIFFSVMSWKKGAESDPLWGSTWEAWRKKLGSVGSKRLDWVKLYHHEKREWGQGRAGLAHGIE